MGQCMAKAVNSATISFACWYTASVTYLLVGEESGTIICAAL